MRLSAGASGVVELVREVAEALPSGPADRGQLVVGERLGDQDVVVDRHRHQPVAPQQRREHVGGEDDVVGRDHGPVGLHLDRAGRRTPQRGGGRVLVDLDAEVRGDARELEGQLRRVHEGGLVGLDRPGEEERAVDLRAHLHGVQEAVAPRAATSTWCCSTATERVPVRSHSQSRPRSRTSASKPARLSWPSRARTSYSSGQRERPLSSPWVSEASQKPPLRPDAAQPIVCASSSTTRRPGSRRLAWTAVQRPR